MRIKAGVSIFAVLFFTLSARACMWDAHSLWTEKRRSHDLASAINGSPVPAVDPDTLQQELKELKAVPRENDVGWLNDLAGTYLRLNQPESAAKLLEPAVARFTNDYGIHANLGTAYHLLGRYADAEKEIARDLEINTNAHFGLEKYHLALLQYLGRDTNYQSRHLYVDEYTHVFLAERARFYYYSDESPETVAPTFTNTFAEAEKEYEVLAKPDPNDFRAKQALATLASRETPPAYRSKWSLASDPNFEAGVIYMAQMNPREPACMQMLGIAAWKKHDYHLAAAAFEKAIALGSPQSGLLRQKVAELNDYISESYANTMPLKIAVIVFIVILFSPILYYIYTKIRDHRRRSKTNA